VKKSHLSIGTVILIIIVVVALQMLRNNSSGSSTGSGSQPPAVSQSVSKPQPPSSTQSKPQSGASGQSKPAAGASSAGGVTYDPSLAKYLPDPKLTPGDTLAVTPQDFCVSGYSSKVRDVPESVKNQVYLEYGITSHKPDAYEVDHLISLELGGSNSIRNLWPESYTGDWNAHIKDKIENQLHTLVCNGSLDMKTAQQAIATNWIAAYQKYVK
jgi:hypothetical protein